MNEIADILDKSVDYSPDLINNVLITLFSVFILWLARFVILKFALARTENVTARHQWHKITTYIASLLGILFIGRIWFEAFQSISTFLGLMSAGLAVALKEPVVNLAGWAYIMLKRPFEIGDRIEISKQSGDVIDIQVFQFTMLEIGNWVDADHSTGRIIHIPNGFIFGQMLANYSKGIPFLWNEIPVLVTFESDWEKAKDILLDISSKNTEDCRQAVELKLKNNRNKYPIHYSRLEPTVYTTVKDSGVMLTIRYLCEPRNRRNSEQSIWEEILREFARCHDIEFAYPTQRFYTMNQPEQ